MSMIPEAEGEMEEPNHLSQVGSVALGRPPLGNFLNSVLHWLICKMGLVCM